MRNSVSALLRAASITICATLPAACSTSRKAPVNFLELADVVAPLPGAKGKTVEDQRKIDRTIAASCGAGVLGTEQCAAHTLASSERKKELRQ